MHKTTTAPGSWGSSVFSEAAVLLSIVWVCADIPWSQDLGPGALFSNSGRSKGKTQKQVSWDDQGHQWLVPGARGAVAVQPVVVAENPNSSSRGESQDRSISP